MDTGVARILGIRFSGFIAWWLWRSVYWMKLPGISKKVKVAVKWSLDLLLPREIEQLVTLRDVERVEHLGATLRAMRLAADPQRETPLRAASDPTGSRDGNYA